MKEEQIPIQTSVTKIDHQTMVWNSEWGLNNMRDINHLQSAKINWQTQQCIVTKTAKRNLAIKPCITYLHQIWYQITQIPITRNSCNSQLQSRIKSSDPFPIVCTSQLQNNPMCTPDIIYQQQNQYQTWPELCNRERHTACYSPHASTHRCLLFIALHSYCHNPMCYQIPVHDQM